MPSPGLPIAHSTQVSFWVLAWKYPNITFWFRIPSTCMMKSLNFSLPHFLLKRIWRLSALTASKGCTDNHFRCLQESLEGKVESAYAYDRHCTELVIYANDWWPESLGKLGKWKYRLLGPLPDGLIKQVWSGSGEKFLNKPAWYMNQGSRHHQELNLFSWCSYLPFLCSSLCCSLASCFIGWVLDSFSRP